MNFPIAHHAGETHGYLIARAIWSTDETPSKWLVFEKGAWYLYTSTTRAIVKAGDLTEADYRALDWHFPAGCGEVEVEQLPDFPGTSQADAPTFDVANPPCRIETAA